jgi:hypothetical protein
MRMAPMWKKKKLSRTLEGAWVTAHPASTHFLSVVDIGLIQNKRCPVVQAATKLEAGIHATEHLKMDTTTTQNSCILKARKALLKQMSNSDVIPGKMKARFEKIEGTNDDVLDGREVILKRFKLFKRHLMNAVVPNQIFLAKKSEQKIGNTNFRSLETAGRTFTTSEPRKAQ